VWFLLADRLGFPLRIPAIPGICAQILLVVPKAVDGLRSGAATVLPLSFCRQSVLLTLLLAEPVAKCCRIIPAHTADRVIIRLLAGRFLATARHAGFFRIGLKLLCLYKLPKLAHSYFVNAHVKGLCQDDFVLWLCRLIQPDHLVVRPHEKLSRWDHFQLHANRI